MDAASAGRGAVSGGAGHGLLLQRALRHALGLELEGFTALPGTGARASFRVETEQGPLLMRLCPGSQERTRAEIAAMRLARAHGVPVARVLHHGPVAGTAGVHALIQAFLPGTPLGPEDPGLVRQAGRLLADLHRIAVTPKDGPGRARWATCIDSWRAAVDAHGGEPFRTLGVPLAEVERRLRRLAALAGDAPPRLLHGEFKLGHVLVHRGAVSGLIDLEWAVPGDPLLDLARWRTTDPAPACWEAFLEGYRTRVELPADVHERLALYGVRVAVEVGLFARATGNQVRWDQLARRLAQDLAATA